MSWTIPSSTVYEFKRATKPKIGVWAIQRGLNSLGWELVEDGVYGAKTKEAVKTFQLSNFLFSDGIFGGKSSQALAADLGMNVGQGKIPVGLLKGIVEGESGGLICAINATVPGGIDCGYCQRRVYEGDYGDDAVIQRAFDGKYQMNLLKNVLVERFGAFRPRSAVSTDEQAWRLATLHHNYPYAADKIATVGVNGLSTYFRTPQTWVENIGASFVDGVAVRTPLEWCQKYSLGSAVHDDPGTMTKYVTDWTVPPRPF